MSYKNLQGLFDANNSKGIKKVVLAGAEDPHALEAVLIAAKEKQLGYILVGDKERTLEVATTLGYELDISLIVHATSPEDAAFLAVEQTRLNIGSFLMKGKMETGTLLKQVVNKNTGLGTGKLMSHLAIVESPNYHKLLGITDGGMIPFPDLEQKKGIIKNAVDVFHELGYKTPKVGVMAAVEAMNPKIQETVDAKTLKDLSFEERYFGDCIIEGPISFDLAVSSESAKTKGYESPVAGDVDIMIMPNLTAGNLTVKAMVCLGNAKMAGCVLGAQVPIVITSRGSSLEEKYISLLLGAAIT